MSFIDELEKTAAITETENGMQAVRTTTDPLVDLFAVLGAMRNRHDYEIVDKFNRAYAEDKKLATKMVFYARDARGGLGERRTGRVMLKELAEKNPELVNKNIKLIPEFGRWDDLFVLFDTECESTMVDYVRTTLHDDCVKMLHEQPVTLLAKWMPSVNTSSADTRKLAKKFIKKLNATDKEYRKTLSKLRKYIDVVERKMSAQEWNNINYEAVPSNAMNRYGHVFGVHDYERFSNYIDAVNSGTKKINASVLFPYDITEKIIDNGYKILADKVALNTISAQWNALPNYVEGEHNYLVMADVSGSMYGRPMATSIGLALYFAERNKGPFANKFMTFSEHPEIVTVMGDTIVDKVLNAKTADWGMDTDIEAAFDSILQTAIRTNCPQSELPESLIIISDMEFDDCTINGVTFYDEMTQRFAEHGYTIPNIVFWNVNSRNDVFHAFADNAHVQLVSGQSASTFKLLMESFSYTPYEMMVKALSDPRYDCIEF